MSYLTLNGKLLECATITIPRHGAWVADVGHVDELGAADGESCTLVFGSQSFVGTVFRTLSNENTTIDTRIVGGAGKLGFMLPVAQYKDPTAYNVIERAISEAGEALSSTSDLATLKSTQFRFWERSQRLLGAELDAVCKAAGLEWRVLLDGKIWIGVLKWNESAIEEYDELDRSADSGMILIGALDPVILPGETFDGVRIGTVVHRIEPEQTRTELYADDGGDRLIGLLDALTRGAQPVDLFGFYEYEVISQNGSTFELKALDPRTPSISKVPYAPPIPGATYAISSGRCLVGFEGGDEQQPYIKAWTAGTPTNVAFPVSSVLSLGADPGAQFVALSNLTGSELSKIASSIANIAAAVNGIAPGSVTNIYGTTVAIGSVAATKVKAT